MVKGGEVRSIVPGGTQTSSIRVPPIIWRVSASRTPAQSASTYTTRATGETGSLYTRDMAVYTFHGVWNRVYMAACDCAPPIPSLLRQ